MSLQPGARVLLVLGLLAGLTPAASSGPASIPAWKDRVVHDFAGVVLIEDSEVIDRIARDVARESGLRMTVVTVKSLEGERLPDLVSRWAEEWGIGKADGGRDLLLLMAAGEGEVALEASEAARGVFTGPTRERILRESIRPFLQRGDYSLGVRRAVEAAARVAAEGYGFDEPAALSSSGSRSLIARGGSLALLLAGILVLAIGLPALLWWLLLGGGERGPGETGD